VSKKIISLFIKESQQGNLLAATGSLLTIFSMILPVYTSTSEPYTSLFENIYLFYKTGNEFSLLSAAITWGIVSSLFALFTGFNKISTLLALSALTFICTSLAFSPVPVAHAGSSLIVFSCGLILTALSPLKI
jgi:hypothetical protein